MRGRLRPNAGIARAIAVVAVFGAAVTWAQTEPRVRIVSPGDDTYVSGPVLLRALVDPPEARAAVRALVLYANGEVACRFERAPFECEWDAGPAVREHHIRAVATLRDGRRLVDTARTRSLGYAETVDVDVVQVTAVVLDRRGRFVEGLPQEAFRIFEDDVPQRITYFAAEGAPLELVAALDVSASMSRALPKVRAAAKQFLTAIAPRDQVTVLAFNDNIFLLARRTMDPAARARAVDRLAPWGGTALYDAILYSLDLLGRQYGRRALVVFTDGDDLHSHVTMEAVVRRVESSDATLYMIGQGQATRLPRLQELLEHLATLSGGRAFFEERPDRLERIFGEVFDDLSNQYLLAYQPARPVRDGRWRRIRVEVPGGDYRVRARQGYRMGEPS